MSRSQWKGPVWDVNIFNIIKKLKQNKKFFIKKLWSRRSEISQFFVGKSIFVHSGNGFRKTYISNSKLGYKLGEFCFTRCLKKKILKKKKKK